MATGNLQTEQATVLPWADDKPLGHVVLVTPFIPPYRVNVYQELAKRCERLTILINTPMPSNRNWQPNHGDLEVIQLKSLKLKRSWKHRIGFTDTFLLYLPLGLLTQLRRLRPDVTLSTDLGTRSLLCMKYRDWFANDTRTILWACISDHTEQGRGWMRERLRRYLLPRADAVVVNGASGRRYCSRFGADVHRIFECPYTAIPGLFDQLPIERQPRRSHRLICAGQLIPRKGLIPLLEALSRWALRRPDQIVEIQFVGGGPLRGQIETMNLPENLKVQMLGEVDYDKLASLYSEAGIMVFPTLADEWGLVVNEAMAAGLPVLGSRYSQAVEELCVEGVTGWTFRPDHQEEFDAAVEVALATPVVQLDKMRHACREMVADLTPTNAAEKIVLVCKSTIKHVQDRSQIDDFIE